MKLLILLKRIIKILYLRNRSVFCIDMKKQYKILCRFPEPKDNYERSYYQYQCQMKQLPVFLVFTQNVSSLLLFPVFYCKLMLNHNKNANYQVTDVALFFTDGISMATIPEELMSETKEIIQCGFAEEMSLGRGELKIVHTLFKRYWFSPFFIFKCMLKVGMYGAKIVKHHPKSIISYSEYSFTSSVLTAYCESLGVEHVNIMHGEKLFNIRDSFVKYSRYYVWDDYYISLLCDLRADREQFLVAVAPSVKVNGEKKEPIFDFTYYLGAEKTDELLKIRTFLQRTGVPDSRVCIRYHPRFCDEVEINNLFGMYHIESPVEVLLSESFSSTRYVVSLYSTVLYQAYVSGKEIIIDDVTDPWKYDKLKELRYMMIDKPHRRLSEFIKLKRVN